MGTVVLVVIAFFGGMAVLLIVARLASKIQPKQPKSRSEQWTDMMGALGKLGYGGMTEDQQMWYFGIVTCLSGDRLDGKRADRLSAADIAWIVETMQETLPVCQRIPTNFETVKAAVQRVAAAQKQLTVVQEHS